MASEPVVLTSEKRVSRPLSLELEQSFIQLGQLKAGWSGEEDSVPPSIKNLNLFRAMLFELPPEFDFPELYATSDGSLEFVWRGCRLYGFLDDELLELEWVGKTVSEVKQFQNTGVVSELLDRLCECLRGAFDRENH